MVDEIRKEGERGREGERERGALSAERARGGRGDSTRSVADDETDIVMDSCQIG